MANRYWVGNGGNWNDTSHWSTTSGGASGASFPTSTDNAYFDANSFTVSGQTVVLNIDISVLNFDWTGVTNSPILDSSYGDHNIYGGFVLHPTITIINHSLWYFWATSGAHTYSTFSKHIGFTSLGINGGSATWNLGSDVLVTSDNYTGGDFELLAGTLNTNNYNLTTIYFSASSNSAKTINLGSSTWTFTGTGTVMNLGGTGSVTVNASTSTLIVSNTSTSAKTIATNGKSLYTLRFTGDNITWNDAATVTNLEIHNAGRPNGLKLGTGTKTITGSMTTNATYTSGEARLVSSTSGTARTISKSSGSVTLNFAYVKDITATGGATFTAAYSTNGGNNTGWTFTTLPAAPTTEQWVHNFNDGSLAPFDSSGNNPWTIDTSGGGSGTVSAKSGVIDANQTSTISFTYTTTNVRNILSYRYRVSSETGYDFLRVYVDGVVEASYSGDSGWQTATISIFEIGSHEVEFTYSKDAFVVSFLDTAWIDDLKILADSPITITSGGTTPVDEAPVFPDYSKIVKPIQNRELFFKVEKLSSAEAVIEEKTITITRGNIDVGSGGFRRKCTFELLEKLPVDWQMRRWKLYYGFKELPTDEITYYPQGVFLPINPTEREALDGYVTIFQGVDKKKLFSDFQLDAPVKFTNGTTVRAVIQTVAGWVGETKLVLAQDLGTLGADFTFEEGSTAEQLLNALITSFSAEWFYDVNGYLVARKRVAPADRAVSFVLDEADNPRYISSERNIDDDNYYNKVTLVGGKIDSPIYRATLSNTDAIAAAGGRIVQKYFKHDAAISQAQVDGLAAYYLSNGVLLPSTLRLTSLVIPDLEVDDIVLKGEQRYEVRSFNIPLSTGHQTITAGEIL